MSLRRCLPPLGIGMLWWLTLAASLQAQPQASAPPLAATPPPAMEVVLAFERQALTMRNATDAAFLEIQTVLEEMAQEPAGEGHGDSNQTGSSQARIQEAVSAFYFAASDASLQAADALLIPPGLSEEVASLLHQARQVFLASMQDRMSLAAALAAGSEGLRGSAEVGRLYATQTGSRDFYFNLLLQEARDAVGH